MAVPKKKTSKSKRDMRRSHHKLEKVNVILTKNGDFQLPHQISLEGYYKNRKVVEEKIDSDDEQDDIK